MTGEDGEYTFAGAGWAGDFKTFRETPAQYIRDSLAAFVREVSGEQLRAWDESIPPLQREVREVEVHSRDSRLYSAILEYQLPMEFRRPDVILLMGGCVLVLELKSHGMRALEDIDQAAEYARDLRVYHETCQKAEVHPVLVLMRSRDAPTTQAGVHIVRPDDLDQLAAELACDDGSTTVSLDAFLSPTAYRPTPSLVEAARALLEYGDLPRIWRSSAATDPALEALTEIAHEAARTRTRHLALVTGLPGTGKTLVGLRLAHARFLDDLAVARDGIRPTAPAVYLSGNGPLVEVLQYELRSAGGGGKAFVRGVKQYVAQYDRHPGSVPPEHVLIFDEAQRAFDPEQVMKTHPGSRRASEPELFVEFAERVPEWCLVVGLIGQGQEINTGEEAGIGQWIEAVERSSRRWTVHAPAVIARQFDGAARLSADDRLHLKEELRYHQARDLHDYVDSLLSNVDTARLAERSRRLETEGYPLRITRDLDIGRRYLLERFGPDPAKRYGLIASSRDRDLIRFGVPNGFQDTKNVPKGPWYAEGDADPRGRSCRTLRTCMTEFGCQGLELDATLLAWGTDLIRERGVWTNKHARRYQEAWRIRDALRLRVNGYRVLLTRARDVVVVFVPPMRLLDETYGYLVDSGFRPLDPPR